MMDTNISDEFMHSGLLVYTVFLLIRVPSLLVALPPEKPLNQDNIHLLIIITMFEEFDEYFS